MGPYYSDRSGFRSRIFGYSESGQKMGFKRHVVQLGFFHFIAKFLAYLMIFQSEVHCENHHICQKFGGKMKKKHFSMALPKPVTRISGTRSITTLLTLFIFLN